MSNTQANTEKLSFILILLIAIISRTLYFADIPLGINCDEAFAAYEAFNLLTEHTDSWGYNWPVYFITGGGGTSALYSYITLPFIAIFGLETWVIRLPQLIFALISCVIFYKLLYQIYDKKTALAGFFIIAIMPWHIILSRWGFHGNLAPAMYLLSFYFYCRAVIDIRYIYLSALFYALSIYTYDLAWGYVALTLPTLWLILLIKSPSPHRIRHIITASILFTLLISPIIALILVNSDIITEIRTPYFSVPKLPGWRGDEVNFSVPLLIINLSTFMRFIQTESDNMIWNTIYPYGLFYHTTKVLLPIGIIIAIIKQKSTSTKEFPYTLCILLQFALGIIYSITFNGTSSNRINYLFFPMLILITLGLSALIKYRKIYLAAIIYLCLAFILFEDKYFTQYNTLAKGNFSRGFKEALAFSEQQHQQTNSPINILSHQSEAIKILYYNQISSKDYRRTVKYSNYPAKYLVSTGFLHYRLYSPYDIDLGDITPNNIYITPAYLRRTFINYLNTYNLQIKTFDNYIVIYDITTK